MDDGGGRIGDVFMVALRGFWGLKKRILVIDSWDKFLRGCY